MPESAMDAEAVRSLLRAQHPDLADLPLARGPVGWDNEQWRLGADRAVRLARSPDADELLLKEYARLPGLAEELPLPVPVPQRLGEPSEGFPRRWLVTTWVHGTPADRAPVTHLASADVLAAFLTALHRPAPDDAPVGRGRGGSLREHERRVVRGLTAYAEHVPDPDAALAVWHDAVAAPEWTGPRVWLHADLHPANVVTAAGALCGVIDFGDLCAGDPACDLAAAWALLPDGATPRFFDGYGHPIDEAMLRRARGWAVWRALGGVVVGEAGRRARPGGKPSWLEPARAALRRVCDLSHFTPLQQDGSARGS